MIDIMFDRKNALPETVIVSCCVCRRKLTVRGNSFRTHWAMCNPCSVDFENGKVDSITFYNPERQTNDNY